MTTVGDSDLRKACVLSRTLAKQWAVVNIGATGAPTIATGAQSPGLTITRTGVGAYTLAFRAATGGLAPKVRACKTTTVMEVTNTSYDLTTGAAAIVCRDAAGAAVEAASGDELLIEIESFPYNAG